MQVKLASRIIHHEVIKFQFNYFVRQTHQPMLVAFPKRFRSSLHSEKIPAPETKVHPFSAW